jgi:hypothetical protein
MFRSSRFVLAIAALQGLSVCPAQTPLQSAVGGGEIRIVTSDMAVLSADDTRKDLVCSVTPLDPRLGFDLQYQAGYVASIPLASLAGEGDSLRVLFRISPVAGDQQHRYFVDRFTVPKIEEGAKGETTLPGQYTLGPGRYRVDWLMRDRAERVCSAHWEIETAATEEFEELAATPMANTVGSRRDDVFLEEPPVQRAAVQSLLHVKLLVNFTPTDPRDVQLRPYDVENIVSILRAISREPQIGTFSVVAFNMQEERIIFEQQNATRIDFPELGTSVESIQGGTVDLQQLRDEESGARFLGEVFREHLRSTDPQPDAIIFVGPKLVLEKRISGELLGRSDHVTCPVFYLIYDRNPRAFPWRDAISSVLRTFKGLEYSITLPRDFGRAMKDMMFRLKK